MAMIQLLQDFANGWIKWISFSWNRSDCARCSDTHSFLEKIDVGHAHKLWLAKGEVSISGLPVLKMVFQWCVAASSKCSDYGEELDTGCICFICFGMLIAFRFTFLSLGKVDPRFQFFTHTHHPTL